jgi:hypothetical protein
MFKVIHPGVLYINIVGFVCLSCGFHATYRVSVCGECLWEENKIASQLIGYKNESTALVYNFHDKMGE